jgi:hypothetical protein
MKILLLIDSVPPKAILSLVYISTENTAVLLTELYNEYCDSSDLARRI